MCAFSDFPPPPQFPNFMHHTMMVSYLDLYAKKFNLLKFVKFRHQVLDVTPTEDFSVSAKWRVTVQDLVTLEFRSELFDGVLVCTGHHVTPNVPHFLDQHLFKG